MEPLCQPVELLLCNHEVSPKGGHRGLSQAAVLDSVIEQCCFSVSLQNQATDFSLDKIIFDYFTG